MYNYSIPYLRDSGETIGSSMSGSISWELSKKTFRNGDVFLSAETWTWRVASGKSRTLWLEHTTPLANGLRVDLCHRHWWLHCSWSWCQFEKTNVSISIADPRMTCDNLYLVPLLWTIDPGQTVVHCTTFCLSRKGVNCNRDGSRCC